MIVAIQAGGAVDIAARVAADALSAKLGQSFVVDNRPGAGGIIGMAEAAQSRADGYTLLFGTAGPITILPQRPSMLAQVDPLKAFKPVALLYSVPLVVIAKKDGRFKTLRELIDYAKRNPGRVTYGSTGVGSINHIAGELFSSLAGISLLHVPYKGTGPVVTDIIGNRLDLYFATLPSWKSSSNSLTVLAVASDKRSDFAPEFPTSAQAGLPGFEFDNWGGIFAPIATPRAVVDKLRRALEAAMKEKTVREKFRAAGNEPDFRAGEQAQAEVEAGFEKMKNLVRDRQLNLDA
ncbi:tripartite tricarboxylate transporter substrate binding protein [Pigmentiphaga soli]|uniref:Tripartite tricarboxylate transporter substrate binding protein n=1 Tax=Pigmentiphaga soli TaxID=1007095 RepID=A0ABP8H1N4_9BURK